MSPLREHGVLRRQLSDIRDVDLQFVCHSSPVILIGQGEEPIARLVGHGELVLALVALESELGDLETAALFSDPFVVAMSPGHPLAQRKRIRASDLSGEEVLLLEDGHCLRQQTAVICDAAGACELGDFRATSLSTLIQMVENGVGVTLLPAMATGGRHLHGRPLTVRPFIRPQPSRTVKLAWRRSCPTGSRSRRSVRC